MHIDKFLEVSDAQAVTATAPSTDVIDTKQVLSNLGMSDLELVVTLAETATAAGEQAEHGNIFVDVGPASGFRHLGDEFAANPGAGTLSLDGKMLDFPHLKQARRVLEAAGLA